MSRGILILTENDCEKKQDILRLTSPTMQRAFPGFFTLWETVVEYQILHHPSSAACAQLRRSIAWIPGSFAIHQLRSAKLLSSAVSVRCLAQLRRLTFQTPWALGLQGDEGTDLKRTLLFSVSVATCPLRGRRHRPFDVCRCYAAGSFAASDRLRMRGNFLARIG